MILLWNIYDVVKDVIVEDPKSINHEGCQAETLPKKATSIQSFGVMYRLIGIVPVNEQQQLPPE